MWHHVTNHLIISNDKDSNSEMKESYMSVTKGIVWPVPGPPLHACMIPLMGWTECNRLHFRRIEHMHTFFTHGKSTSIGSAAEATSIRSTA
jgi:hypothetical protein